MLEKVGVCRHTTKLRKKGRGRKFSLRSKNIPPSLSPIKAIQTSSLCGKGRGFRVERRSAATTKTNSRSQFSTVWFLGRSRSDKDKGTTNRPSRRKRAALRRGAITLPYRAYNVRTLICIRVAFYWLRLLRSNGRSQMGMR